MKKIGKWITPISVSEMPLVRLICIQNLTAYNVFTQKRTLSQHSVTKSALNQFLCVFLRIIIVIC